MGGFCYRGVEMSVIGDYFSALGHSVLRYSAVVIPWLKIPADNQT